MIVVAFLTNVIEQVLMLAELNLCFPCNYRSDEFVS